jgi:hypothetical protein
MKLNEISSQDIKTSAFIKSMKKYSTILDYAEFYRIIGNSDMPRKKASAAGGQFRAINDNWVSNQVSPLFGSVNLKIFGDKVEVDKAHERRAGDINSERARQLINFAEEFGKNFQNEFFNGKTNSNVKSWNGLVSIIPAQQVIVADESGLLVQAGNSDAAALSKQKLLEKLRKLITMVDGGAEVLYMNEDVWTRLTTIAAEYISWEKNDFGNMISYFGGVPIRSGGYNSSGSLVIPANELFGEFNTATTVYAMRFGEKKDLTIGTSNGLNIDDLGLVNNHYVDNVELDADLCLLNNRAVAALKGIVIE